ncbi:MAG: 4Fe-4S binding protein [Elusimicrobia bacterium]|nr:4Fe-4S binding protein [Elusimicrobiota bacterium]
MGHAVARDAYRRLGGRLDSLACRTPWNEAFRAVLAALYSREEAELVSRMPAGLCGLERLAQLAQVPPETLRGRLEALADKGLVLDLRLRDRTLYAPSPFIIGIFEFTLMRTKGRLETAAWARLFRDYLDDGEFWRANFGRGEGTSILRTLPQEAALPDGGSVEILDYEKASALIAGARRLAVGLCACRHEKLHLGTKACAVPLETCTSFDLAADYLIRHGLAREISRSEMEELFAASRQRRLVLCADNVQRGVCYVCHCCKCCCVALEAITRHGCANAVVTSGFIAAAAEPGNCSGCGACARNCPVGAITVAQHRPAVNQETCLGCGVCVLSCAPKALALRRRKQRVIPPESMFEKIMLQALERGTLQDQLFDDPQKATHKLLRAFVGGFLRLEPVKRALASSLLSSRFLSVLKAGAAARGLDDIL